MKSAEARRKVNGYTIETRGGFICVKRWAVLRDGRLIAVYLKYREAKRACETEDFSGGLKSDIY